MAFVQALLADPSIPIKDRQDALHRVFADPGIPGPLRESTSSFWFKDPHPQLANMQSPELPQEADVVIIGSGITGASIARTLLESSDQLGHIGKKTPAVVMLEARDTCTGATGRNGGHILETVEEFADWEALYGLEAAKALMRFRLAHLAEILKVADQYGLKKETQARKTNTPVTQVSTDDTSSLRYAVQTPRGILRARHVIHCTNAHVGHLVPELRGHVYPVRGQMSAQNPGSKFICQATEHSWLFNYERGFDYLTQLPPAGESSGKMMLGGGFAQGRNNGLADLGIPTDSELSLSCDIHLSGALSAVFGRENWGHVAGPSVEQMWTGNMGFSSDGLPWVGQLPSSVSYAAGTTEQDGAQWVCCGFSGEGMVQAWLSGTAVAKMLLSSDRKHHLRPDYLSWFPEQMLLTEERLEKAGLTRVVSDRASNL
ncbi:unnamed protein product [Aspergillus oryzae]|nr:unnamed protein product [Aspergillus oryzae]